MIITAGSRPFGVAAKILLDCARQLHERAAPFSFIDFCRALGAPEQECLPVFREMLGAGHFTEMGDGLHAPAEPFNRLALASIGVGISRKAADALLVRVIAAAARINADPDTYQCRVQRLAVFGSYLSDKPVLGDLDIAVDMAELPPANERAAVERIRRMMAGRAPVVSGAYAALRLRKPKQISIHGFEELADLGTPYKVVFEAAD